MSETILIRVPKKLLEAVNEAEVANKTNYCDMGPYGPSTYHDLADAKVALADAVVKANQGEGNEIERLLRMGKEWTLPSFLARLIGAAEHLLHDHDCDAHGYEGVSAAVDAARAWLKEEGWASTLPITKRRSGQLFDKEKLFKMAQRIEEPETGFTAGRPPHMRTPKDIADHLPSRPLTPVRNGGVECDALDGGFPCACGSWHAAKKGGES